MARVGICSMFHQDLHNSCMARNGCCVNGLKSSQLRWLRWLRWNSFNMFQPLVDSNWIQLVCLGNVGEHGLRLENSKCWTSKISPENLVETRRFSLLASWLAGDIQISTRLQQRSQGFRKAKPWMVWESIGLRYLRCTTSKSSSGATEYYTIGFCIDTMICRTTKQFGLNPNLPQFMMVALLYNVFFNGLV